jgi:hypothetical protein
MAEKTYTPTDGMASAARRALKWKEEGRRGGTTVGLARANQLVKKESLSQSTVLRMYSFFSRHEVDKKAEGFNSGEEGFPSPGRVAWDLWGGDAGASWSKQKRDQIMNDRMNKSIWAGVFFPADEPALVDIAEEEGAPLDEPIIEEAVVETQAPEIVEESAQPVEEIVAEENSNTETEEEVIEETVAVEEVAEEPSEEATAPEVSEETSAE